MKVCKYLWVICVQVCAYSINSMTSGQERKKKALAQATQQTQGSPIPLMPHSQVLPLTQVQARSVLYSSKPPAPQDLLRTTLVASEELSRGDVLTFNLRSACPGHMTSMMRDAQNLQDWAISLPEEFWIDAGVPIGYGASADEIEKGRRLLHIDFYGSQDPRLDFTENRSSKLKR